MRQSKKINDMTVQWAIPTIILLVFLVVTLISYNSTMEENAEEKALDKISRQAVSVAGYYNGLFDAIFDVSEAFADDMLSTSDNLFDERQVEMMSQIVRKLGLKKAYIVKSDYSAIDNDGKIYIKVSDNETFLSLIESNVGSASYIDERGDAILLISSPIRTEKEWWGNVVFVFKPTKLSELIETTSYSYSLVFSNGLVAETIGGDNGIFTTGDNINKSFENLTFMEGSLSSLQQYIEAGRSGLVVVLDSNGNKQYIRYQPIGKYKTCVMVSVKEKQVKRSIKEENKPTSSLIIKILVSMGIFVALVITIYVINRVGFAKQSKELQNKAETDLLTDLLNKVSTEKKIIEYISGEGKDKISMMCVLDIDNFKKINDTMGHAFGDEVLSTLGKKIQSEFRVTDIVGRTGGDEFILFLKDLKEDEIIDREAQRIANFFKDFQVGSYQKYSPTASIGAAIFPRDAGDFESLYKAADTALYKAKKRGKNQLAFYRDATDEDKLEALESKKPKATSEPR